VFGFDVLVNNNPRHNEISTNPVILNLGLGWSYPSDCWSVGCILAELLNGELLFATHSDHEHLCLMEKILNRSIPQWMAHEALRDARDQERRNMNNRYYQCDYNHRRDRYQRNDRRYSPSPSHSHCRSDDSGSSASTAAPDELLHLRTEKLKDLSSGKQRRKVREAKTLKEQFYHHPPDFADLVAGLLTFDPHQRLTAREALRHPFFG